jgi:uncharacterized damage-inducible protein DinB
MSITQALLPEYDQEIAKTRTALERIPEDKLGWKPHEKSMTLGGLATHMAQIPMWGSMTLTTTELDIQPPGAPPFVPEVFASRTEVLAKFDEHAAGTRKALEAASDDDWMQTWTLLKTGVVAFAMPRAAVFRGMIMNHLVHHRGQLSVYLRLNDIPVPSIYGPSADESGM